MSDVRFGGAGEWWEENWEKLTNVRAPNPFALTVVQSVPDLRGKYILDAGAGDGRDSFLFLEHGAQVVAADQAGSGLKLFQDVVRRRGLDGAALVVNLEHDLPTLGDAMFDVIYAHRSLQYFTDETTHSILEDMYQLLKDDGWLFVKVKSAKDKWANEGEPMDDGRRLNRYPRRFFTAGELRALVEQAGFSDIQLRELKEPTTDYVADFIEIVARKIARNDE